MQQKIDQFHNLETEVISINPDSGAHAQQVAQQIGATFPLLSDPDLTVTQQFDMQLRVGWPMGNMGSGLPEMGYVIVDGKGIIRAQRVDVYFGAAAPQILRWLTDLP